MSVNGQRMWNTSTQEHKVEKLYSHGVENYGDFHDGYLNFGLWENGDEDYVNAARNLVRRMGQLLGLDQHSRLLDVAPGMGTQDIFLYENFSPASIDGVDVTWKHIEHGRRRADEADANDRVRFHHGTATSLPFADASFTHVLSIEGAEHFDTREKFMNEARRVLKPGGVIGLADFVAKKKPRTITERVVGEAARALWKVPRANVYTADVYREKMRQAGFRNVEVSEIGESVIPGYYFEQRRPEIIRAVRKIRGEVATRLSVLLDIAVYRGFQMGLLEYVLVRAERA